MKPLKDIKIFESLNCILCKEPFVPTARQPRSPRRLTCGPAMCHECFEKEKSLKKEERKHQCNYIVDCFFSPSFAYDLIGVLSQDCFTLSPILGGYLLKKPSIHECPICYQKRREQNSDVATQASRTDTVACLICNPNTLTNGESFLSDYLQDFLNELPEMTRQLEEMNESGYRFCDECKKLDMADEMYHCDKCLLQLCGKCIYKDHRSHEAITLLQKEAGQMLHKLCSLSINEVQTYHQLFSELHKELSDGLQGLDQKLLKKARDLTNAPAFEDLRKEHKKCTELKADFETCSEEYMHHLRKYDKRVKELMKALDDDPN